MKIGDKMKIGLQFYEGGSLSDPFRNGARAISAQINAFGLHDFAKFTFQGRDMYNYFNHPGSNERMFTRHFTDPAQDVKTNSKGQWYMSRKSDHDTDTILPGKDRRPNEIIEEAAIAALKRTIKDYQTEDFQKTGLGTLYAMLGEGYNRESVAANRGSRAASRGGAFAKVDSTHMGQVWTVDLVNNVRTIPFSMMPQQNRFVGSFVGGQNLNTYLYEEITKRLPTVQVNENDTKKKQADANQFIEFFKDLKNGSSSQLTPAHMNHLYEKSPTFRDAMDKVAFAIARTDMVAVEEDVKAKFAKRQSGIDEWVFQGEDQTSLGGIRAAGRSYVEKLKGTFQAVGKMAYEAVLGSSYDKISNSPRAHQRYAEGGQTANMQADAMFVLSALGDDIALKNNYLDFLVHTKAVLGQPLQTAKPGDDEPVAHKDRLGTDDSLLAIILAGGLASTHSRWLKSDDPTAYGHLHHNNKPDKTQAK